MKCNSRPKAALVVLLSISLLATGCTAQWISVALADLPVLLQMALNIGSLVTTLQSGQQLSASEAQAIQSISAEASKDLNLLQTLYNQYQANPTASALQKIQSTVADISHNLPALLQAAHIGDPVLAARMASAVNYTGDRDQLCSTDPASVGDANRPDSRGSVVRKEGNYSSAAGPQEAVEPDRMRHHGESQPGFRVLSLPAEIAARFSPAASVCLGNRAGRGIFTFASSGRHLW
jgi:hypothetical protein